MDETEMPREDRELRLKRLRLAACQRGLLEAELVLRPFAEQHLHNLSPVQLDCLERLLDLPDLDLWEIITGRRAAPPDVDEALLAMLRGPLQK